MFSTDPDWALVKAVQGGDKTSFDQLLALHQERIFHFIWRHIPNESDAADLAQETFVRAYFNINKFSPKGLFSSWLYQIALNLCRDFVRSKAWRNRQQTDSLTEVSTASEEVGQRDLQDSSSNPVAEIRGKEVERTLRQAIEKLPLGLKGPLLLTAVEGLSHFEAGQRLGLTAKAVEVKVYRARKSLHRQLGMK